MNGGNRDAGHLYNVGIVQVLDRNRERYGAMVPQEGIARPGGIDGRVRLNKKSSSYQQPCRWTSCLIPATTPYK